MSLGDRAFGDPETPADRAKDASVVSVGSGQHAHAVSCSEERHPDQASRHTQAGHFSPHTVGVAGVLT